MGIMFIVVIEFYVFFFPLVSNLGLNLTVPDYRQEVQWKFYIFYCILHFLVFESHHISVFKDNISIFYICILKHINLIHVNSKKNK